jgi:hypothetical protein
VLLQAAAQAHGVMHLGIVHIEESGSAESYYDDYRSRGRSRNWGDDDDDDDDGSEENVSNDDIEIVDVHDSAC